MNKRLAFIMAGGSGERFWPVSTKEHPKQFLKLASPDATLLEQSVNRAASVVGIENTHIATSKILADKSRFACPSLNKEGVLAEPAKKNTAGCLVWVTANLIARDPDGWPQTTAAILTADQRIHPEQNFVETVNQAMDAAEQNGTIVTIGIRPDRPETGFGYIEVGDPNGKAQSVKQFREKPDLDTAKQYVQHGGFLWNSGMFFFTVPTFMAELEAAQPEMADLTRKIAGHLAQNEIEQAEEVFNQLPSISVDYAVMEPSKRVDVVEATFTWDDLGAWDAISRSYPLDENQNVALGSARVLESEGTVVYNTDDEQEVCVLGAQDLVVVVSNGKILVSPKDRAQEVKKFLK